MWSWRPSRPSPAMTVALLSLCVALGGSALAATKLAPKNSVNSAAVINGTLRLKDFKTSERAKLKGPKGVKGDPGPAGTPDGYTKTEADGRFLGTGAKAADADSVDGIDSSGLIQGGGSVTSAFNVFADGEGAQSFIKLPGLGAVGFGCGSSMSWGFTASNEAAGPVLWELNDTGTLTSHTNSFGAAYLLILGSTSHEMVGQFHRGQDSATLIMSIFRGATGDNATDCRVHAQMFHNRS